MNYAQMLLMDYELLIVLDGDIPLTSMMHNLKREHAYYMELKF